jgi:heterodisulfide reductase subunit A
MKEYLVIGAGISGCTAALALAESGHKVHILERDSIAGGKVLDYCCKATDSCSRCGVCVAHTRIRDAVKHPNINVVSGFSLDTVSKTAKKVTVKGKRNNPWIDYKLCHMCNACVDACPENCISVYQRGELVQYRIDYSACRLHNGKQCDLCIKACDAKAISGETGDLHMTVKGERALVATGHTVFNPEEKPRYGYLRSEKIITGEEAESRLSSETGLGDAQDIAFVQCVGSRDPVLGRNYCSAVCCSYALRLARVLKYRKPNLKVTIYYIDIQNFDKEYNHLRKEIEDLGVIFHRGVPFLVEEIVNGKLRFLIESDDDRESIVFHDMAVLSVGMGPNSEASAVGQLFGVEQDEFGFYFPDAKEEGTGKIYSTGTCREPMSMPESMAAAEAVAFEMMTSGEDKNG